MATLADSLISSTSRSLTLRMRPDLSSRRQQYQGRAYWVIKEPVGLKYYRFHEEEYAILNMLDGHTSMDAIKEQFEREFAPQKVTFQDLQHFIGMLHRSGLVISESTGQGKQLKHRGDTKRRKEFLGKLTNVFAVRWRGIDPERILNRIYPYTGWFFSWVTVTFAALLAVSALMLVIIQFDVFSAKLPTFHQFFGPRNWIYLAVTMGVVKVIHEFGHGLTCKRYGGECHEMGFMLLVFTPALYCNVSDSWMLPNKWHRVFIGAAGIYVEIFLASAATFVWWFSGPGLVNQLALSIMFICSVSTILFNGNPLLRFDGYYILMDLVEIPNLRQKSSEVLKRFLAGLCLGLEQPENPFLPQRNRFFFGLYTVAAVLYRWFIVFSIFMFLNQVLEPYGLKVLGQILGGLGVFGLVVQPLIQLCKFFYTPGRLYKVKRHRLLISASVVGAIILAILFVPYTYHIECPVRIVARESVKDVTTGETYRVSATVYAQVSGELSYRVKPGNWVEQGDVIAHLENDDEHIRLIELEGQLAEARQQRVVLSMQRSVDLQAAELLHETDERIVALANQIEQQNVKVAKLDVRSPISGVVIPASYRPKSGRQDGRLPQWHGSLMEDRNLGAFVSPDDPICTVVTPREADKEAARQALPGEAMAGISFQLDAELVIDQGDIELIQPQNQVEICLELYPDDVIESKITRLAFGNLKESPTSISSQSGGQLGTVMDQSGAARPISTSYYARAQIPDSSRLLHQVDLRGRARVYPGVSRSLGGRIWRFVTRTFHFSM